MIAPLAKLIDWYALQVAAMVRSVPKCARGDSKLTKAILTGPDFIPSENRPAELEFKSEQPFHIPIAATVRVCGKQRRSRKGRDESPGTSRSDSQRRVM